MIYYTIYLILAMNYIPVEMSTPGMADSHLFDNYIGEYKGIQGHQNSCYLDATLFGLFALSSAFDELFLHDDTNNSQSIENIIWKKIVNPLRRCDNHYLDSFLFFYFSTPCPKSRLYV